MSGYEVVTDFAVGVAGQATRSVSCPAGKKVVGGFFWGSNANGGVTFRLDQIQSIISADGNFYSVAAEDSQLADGDGRLNVRATCAVVG